MKFILALSLVFGMTGCDWFKKTGCSVAKRASDVLSHEIAGQLACKNVDAIKKVVDAQLEKVHVCEVGAVGIIGDLVCPPLIGILINGSISQLPAEWECSGGPAKEGLSDLLIETCKKAF